MLQRMPFFIYLITNVSTQSNGEYLRQFINARDAAAFIRYGSASPSIGAVKAFDLRLTAIADKRFARIRRVALRCGARRIQC